MSAKSIRSLLIVVLFAAALLMSACDSGNGGDIIDLATCGDALSCVEKIESVGQSPDAYAICEFFGGHKDAKGNCIN